MNELINLLTELNAIYDRTLEAAREELEIISDAIEIEQFPEINGVVYL